MKTVVVIPAYNEAGTIADLAKRIVAQALPLIVIDDASTDNTATELAGLPVTLLRNKTNCGKGGSLWRGMQAALEQGADQIITLDGDGQHRPEDIPRLLEAALQQPAYIIIGARQLNTEQAPRARKMANHIADFWISWAAGYPIKDSQSGFRLYPAQLINRIKIPTGNDRGFVFESEILIKAAEQNVYSDSVPIPSIYHPNARPSHFRPAQDITRITRMVGSHLIRRGMAPMSLLRSLGILSVAEKGASTASQVRH